MFWHNEPAQWRQITNKMMVRAEAATDFWRTTHYGFIRDNGHFYYQVVDYDFIATVQVTGYYKDLYDQAGLMVREDEENWLKTGIEFVNGIQNISAVVTHSFSDWSVAPYPADGPSLFLKLTRRSDYIRIDYSLDGEVFTMLRLAYFRPAAILQVGLMCAAPGGAGFDVLFDNFQLSNCIDLSE